MRRKVQQVVRQAVRQSNAAGLGQCQPQPLGQYGYDPACKYDCRLDEWGNLIDVNACNDCLLAHPPAPKKDENSFANFLANLFSW